MPRIRSALIVVALLTLTAGPAFGLRNAIIALNNVKIDEALIAGPISVTTRNELFRAQTLLRDMDYALERAVNSLNRSADRANPTWQEVAGRYKVMLEQRNKLGENINEALDAAKVLGDLGKEFETEVASGPIAAAVGTVEAARDGRLGGGADAARKVPDALVLLATLDQLCKTKYALINGTQSRHATMDPLKQCEVAAKRAEFVANWARNSANRDAAFLTQLAEESRKGLTTDNGHLGMVGIVSQLAFEPEEAKAAFLAANGPRFVAAGLPIPPDLFASCEAARVALWAEVDRLAPTWSWPTETFKDGKLEGGARSTLARLVKGAKVLKSAMLHSAWSINKNEYGLPKWKFRSGAVLYKASDSQWCQYRGFTATLEYSGGGRYESTPEYSFGPVRYQACK